MKHRTLTVMILCLALLLAACRQVTPPATDGATSPSSGANTVATTESATSSSPSTAATAPSETPTDPPTPVIPAWYPAPRQYMSYDDFFSQVKTLNFYNFWLAPYESGYKLYRANQTQDGVIVMNSDGLRIHIVPGGDTYGFNSENYFIGSDGFVAYLFNETELFRLDMLTGEKTSLVKYDRVHHSVRHHCFHLYSRDLIYFAAVVEGKITINRLYLPTGQLDVLNDDLPASIPEGCFTFHPYVTIDADTLSWSCMNPELNAVLQQELKNPDSSYKAKYPEFWADPSLFENSWMIEDLDLFYQLQQATGIPGTMSVTLNLSDMSTEVKYAKYANNTYGEYGYVDTNDPVAYDPIPPQWIMSDPVSIPELILPDNAQALYDFPEQYGQVGADLFATLCNDAGEEVLYVLSTDGVYYPYGNYPANTTVEIPTHRSFRQEGNQIVQLSPDGSGKQVIYTAQHGSLYCYFTMGYLYIWDGDYILQIDIPAKTIRTILTVPYALSFPHFNRNTVEIQTTHGLTYRRYICRIDTGEIEEFTTPF